MTMETHSGLPSGDVGVALIRHVEHGWMLAVWMAGAGEDGAWQGVAFVPSTGRLLAVRFLDDQAPLAVEWMALPK